MDMYRNHGTSLSQGEGAMFGEYSTTPSKYGIKSRRRYTLSTDVIPSVSTEFGEYQKTTTEIGQDSVSNPLNGVYKNKMNIAAKLLDFGETTNTNGVNTNFDSSYDILQPKNSVVRESAQFGEYKTTTRKIVKKTGFTTSNDALSSKDIYDINFQSNSTNINNGNEFQSQNIDFTNTNNLEGFDQQFNFSDDILQLTSEANYFDKANSNFDSGAIEGDYQTKNENLGYETHFNSSNEFMQTTTGVEEGAQFGEYKSTKVTKSHDGPLSAADLLGLKDFTASTPIVDTNIAEGMPNVDSSSYFNFSDGNAITTSNYNFGYSEPIVDTNSYQENDQKTNISSLDINLNDYQAKEAIVDDIKQNLEVYHGVLHQSIEPVVDSNDYTNDSQIFNENANLQTNQDFNFSEYKSSEQPKKDISTNFDMGDFHSKDQIIDTTPTFTENYTNIDTTAFNETEAFTDNYQNIETTNTFDIE